MRAGPVRRGGRFGRSYPNINVVLHEFDVYDVGVSRAEAAEFLANGTGIVSIIELLLALTIGGPPAIAAGIPASDPRISSGRSVMQYGIRHSLPSRSRTGECACLVLPNFQHWPIPNRRHRTRSRLKKDTALKGCCAKSARGRSDDHRNAGGSLSGAPGVGAVVMTGDGINRLGVCS